MTQTQSRLILAASAAALLVGLAPPARAQPIATGDATPVAISQEQLLALTARLDALERRNSDLEAEVSRLKVKTQTAETAARPAPTSASASLANGRPVLSSADGRFTAALRGIVQLDAAQYDQAAAGPLASDFRRGSIGDAAEADHARDLSDGANFRRVRFGVEGKAWGDWNYNLLFDFGGSGVEEAGKINNAYLEYAGLAPVRLRIGAFAPTTGLEDATANTQTLFLERPAPAELVRNLAGGDGRTGAALYANGARWTLQAAITGNVVATPSFDEQLGFVGRASWVPLKTEAGLVHVGVSANLILNPAASGPSIAPLGAVTPVRLRERPELRVDGARLVDTGAINASGVNAFGLELGGVYRAFSLAGEYFRVDVSRRASLLPDPHFSGWYVQGAWTLTGQPRRYNPVAGGLDSPRVEAPFDLKARQWGVWELAARVSDLNLDDRAGAPGTGLTPDGFRGGEQRGFTLGLNWYPNAAVRFLADYQRIEVRRLSPGGTAFGPGALTPPAGAQIGQDLNIWSLRTQYAF